MPEPRSWAQIADTMIMRRREDPALFRRMADVRDRYNGDLVVAMPDVVGAEDLPPLTPQLIYDGIEHTAMRSASTMPIISTPPASVGSDQAAQRAERRRKALYGRWFESNITNKWRRAYRQLIGYGTCCFVVMPDERGAARVEIRDPLSAYPEFRDPDDIRQPDNVGFVYGRSADWVRRHYPEAIMANVVGSDGVYDFVEWIDEYDIVVGLLGRRELVYGTRDQREVDFSGMGMELRRYPNTAQMVPAAIPRRVTLDRVAGQMQQILPIVDWQQRLMALDVIAAERGVFPDMAILGENNQAPVISDGEWKDGRTGEVNFITGARDMRLLAQQTPPMTNEMIDRLERAGRHTGGISALGQGELTGAIRSGRTVDSIANIAIDPRIQELQDLMARTLTVVNRAIMSVEKGEAPKATHTIFSGWPGADGTVDYKPDRDYDTIENVVAYPFPGTDITQLTVAIQQMNAGGLMSRHTARTKHPFIESADDEERRILIEAVDDAATTGLQQQVASGTLPLIDLVTIRESLGDGNTVIEAIRAADEAARERQAAQPAPPGPDQALSPQGQPGLAPPGVGAETTAEPPVNPGEPPGGLENLQQLFSALSTTSRPPVRG